MVHVAVVATVADRRRCCLNVSIKNMAPFRFFFSRTDLKDFVKLSL